MKLILPILLVLALAYAVIASPRNPRPTVLYGHSSVIKGHIVSGNSVVSDSFAIPEHLVGRPMVVYVYMYSVKDSSANMQINLLRGMPTLFQDTFYFGKGYNSSAFYFDTTEVLAIGSADSTWHKTEFMKDDTLMVGLSGSTEQKRFTMFPYDLVKYIITGQTSGAPSNPDSARVLINFLFYRRDTQVGQ